MNSKEKEQVVENALKFQNVFKVNSVLNINHKPHPYMIGPNHIKANDSVYLSIERCEKQGVYCAHPGCGEKYKDHTSDEVIALKLLKNATNKEANDSLKDLIKVIGEDFVDGFIFVENEDKFEIS